MRRVLPFALLIMVAVIPSIVGAIDEGEIYAQGLFVPMKVLLNGKESGTQLVVNYHVINSGGRWIVSWEEVKIFQDTLSKKTVLLPVIWSTSGGDIKNVVVRGDSASFDLVMAYGEARVVVGKGVVSTIPTPDVKVTLVYLDSSSKKNITEEWVMTDRIVLPSKEVYKARDAGDALFVGGKGKK